MPEAFVRETLRTARTKASPQGGRALAGGGPLAGRVAVVSGGGRGLGRSFCLALARQGARVVVNNRNRVVDSGGLGPADHVVAEIAAAGGEAVADYADAAAADSGEAMVTTALDRWGRLDICVANAAIGVGGMFHRQPAEQFDEVLEINLHGSNTDGSSWSPPPAGCTATSACPPTPPARAACWPSAGRSRPRARPRAC
ncbi:MAG: SDR family NAD(P)-dependent oxidoreductase [Streptosporangiaceae bacterium]